ncbi:hypothetical protein F5Y15DRAFT_1519 [Xylariaceae sp. FL0016]|nr:hypothetical protein F5Y15DRAFT_1519 [Xylariaceae sp. FL0016]
MDHEQAAASKRSSQDSKDTDLSEARLRRNQRNSRARKQAYIRDLETRWDECMRTGAQATVEMQGAARRVHEENRLLRTLLHGQGMDNRAIQNALEALRASPASTSPLSPIHADDPNMAQHGINSLAPELWPMSEETLPDGDAVSHKPDTVQSLDLQHWLSDLCDIKDAFGTEANSQFSDSNPQGSVYDAVIGGGTSNTDGIDGANLLPRPSQAAPTESTSSNCCRIARYPDLQM